VNEFNIPEHEYLKTQLHGSFLLFCQTFFPLVTSRKFEISNPTGRESHHKIISRALTKVSDCEINSLLINIQPGSGKSVLLSMWVAWMMSRYPDSNFLYIAFSHDLASKHTAFIKRVMENSHYRTIFGVDIRSDSKAKDHFSTVQGGIIRGFSSGGPVTGADGGFMTTEKRFTGAVICDDMTKPDDAYSPAMRENILRNYRETILQRPRGPHVPIICIAQRLHEDDICAYMMSGKDERKWDTVILPSLDGAGNALCPDVTTKEQLIEKREKNSYTYGAQYNQDPLPPGGALYKSHEFIILDEEPDILVTFLVADTAETSKSYNDASAFMFAGLYKLETGELALHILDAWEIRVEPRDLESQFKSFYADCMLHRVKPKMAAIEKKSTGVTLLSILDGMRGLELREVKRTRASGSKTARFLEMQPIIASKLISFPSGAKHTELCVNHMIKITANDSHAHDDLADCMYDCIKIALIDKTLYTGDLDQRNKRVTQSLARDFNRKSRAIAGAR